MTLRTILILVVFSSLAQAEDIFWPKGWYQVGSNPLDISTKVLEEKLSYFLEKKSQHTLYQSNQYIYQYHVSSGNLVKIQAICSNIPKRHRLSEKFLRVFEGGSCFFGVFYNTESEEFYNFRVNSEL